MTTPGGEHPRFVVRDDVVDEATLRALRQDVRASALIGPSQLVGGFSATRGFGVVFHLDAVDDALQRAPLFAPFFPLAFAREAIDTARPPSTPDRLGRLLFGAENAVYANVLVVGDGAAVERHVDATLGTRQGDPRVIVPRAVAVLYVDVPDAMRGGDLVLTDPDDATRELARITPKPGRLVHFDGRLAHAVEAAGFQHGDDSTSASARISLVAEVYRLPRDRLRLLPKVRLQSNGFQAVLERLRR